MTTVSSIDTSEDVKKLWRTICHRTDLVKDSGVNALIEHQQETKQIAIFHVPKTENEVYAVANFDPIGKANVLYRGIVGCVQGEPVVCSPLYKQHYSLTTGRCLQEDTRIETFNVRIKDDHVQVLY